MVLLRAPQRATDSIPMKYQNFNIPNIKISKSQYLKFEIVVKIGVIGFYSRERDLQ